MRDEHIISLFEIDQETLMLVQGVSIGVEISIQKIFENKTEKGEQIPYSHYVSTLIFYLCCFLHRKGLNAQQTTSLISKISEIAEVHMNNLDKDPDTTIH